MLWASGEAMDKGEKKYDLEERTLAFAQQVRRFIRRVPKGLANTEDLRQLARSSGSIGANYIEANEALGKKDFLMHVRICRKEAKETRYWLTLLDLGGDGPIVLEQRGLLAEATELMHIFGAIITKVEKRD